MIIIVRTRAINRVIPIYYSISQPLYLMMSYRKEELYRIMGPTEAQKSALRQGWRDFALAHDNKRPLAKNSAQAIPTPPPPLDFVLFFTRDIVHSDGHPVFFDTCRPLCYRKSGGSSIKAGEAGFL